MSIVDRLRFGAAHTRADTAEPIATLTLDLASGVISAAALQAEITSHLINARLAIALNAGDRELLIPGHQPIRFSSDNPLSPNNNLRIYEETTTLALSYLIDRFRTATFFDIGAGIGYFSRIAASSLSCDVTVHAFEMRPDRLQRLRACVAGDTFGAQVHSHLIGLTDTHKGENEIYYASSILFETPPQARDYRERWRWLKFNVRGGFNRDFASAKVLMTSLDHFCASQAARPDIIKIDVDGYEGRVLEGATETLKRDRPFLLLELHKDKKLRFGVRRRDIAERLFEAGYRALFFTDHQNRLKCKVIDLSRGNALIDRQETDLILFYHPGYLDVRPAATR